ncbi:hypothetical protein ACFRH4_30690 [Streptomyces mirabilis]|uniref:hypothetical protein n=1 Tax=Streptomyces mirabilis TaxID=68239 RepID=UPI0036CA8B91
MSAAAVIAVAGAGTAVSHAEGAPAGALAADAAASVRAHFDGDGYTDVAIAAPPGGPHRPPRRPRRPCLCHGSGRCGRRWHHRPGGQHWSVGLGRRRDDPAAPSATAERYWERSGGRAVHRLPRHRVRGQHRPR